MWGSESWSNSILFPICFQSLPTNEIVLRKSEETRCVSFVMSLRRNFSTGPIASSFDANWETDESLPFFQTPGDSKNFCFREARFPWFKKERTGSGRPSIPSSPWNGKTSPSCSTLIGPMMWHVIFSREEKSPAWKGPGSSKRRFKSGGAVLIFFSKKTDRKFFWK